MIDDKIFGKRLSYLLKQKKMSQSKLAKAIGTNSTNISNLIYGRGTTLVKRYQQIADALGVSSAYLVGESDDINGGSFSGKRPCKTCFREIYGNKFECAECQAARIRQRRELFKKPVKKDKGLVGTMAEASRIARQAREHGMSYGKYAAMYDRMK